MLLLYAFWPVLWLIYRFPDWRNMRKLALVRGLEIVVAIVRRT